MRPVIVSEGSQKYPLVRGYTGDGGLGGGGLGSPTLPRLADDPCVCCGPTPLTCVEACQNPPAEITVTGLPFNDPIVFTLRASVTCRNSWGYFNFTVMAEFFPATQTTIIWLENAGICRWQDEFAGNLCSAPYVEVPFLWGNQFCRDATIRIS